MIKPEKVIGLTLDELSKLTKKYVVTAVDGQPRAYSMQLRTADTLWVTVFAGKVETAKYKNE